ncbi:MAG: transcriptional regulator [Woeseia sp.]
MASDFRRGLRLGPWRIEPPRGAVTGPEGNSGHLEPKVMDVFVYLAEHADELVTRDELLEAVWEGRALHDDRGDPKYIETVPKRGYRLIGDLCLPDGSRLEKEQTRPQSNRRKMVFVVAAGLAFALVYFAYSRFAIDPAPTGTPGSDAPDMSIAVLPFANMSPGQRGSDRWT